MHRIHRSKKAQRGLFLLEALVAILIFSLGILGLVAMGSTAIAGQSDAQYRSEAAAFATDIQSRIALSVDPANVAGTIDNFKHMETTTDYCDFGGNPSTNAVVTDWLARVTGAGGLPGAVNARIQIRTQPGNVEHNRVTVTLCWKPPTRESGTFAAGAAWRRLESVAYVNLK